MPKTTVSLSAQTGALDLQACRALMRGGSKTFFAASRLLPARVRVPAIALYAFCRVADDAIDLSDDRNAALAVLMQRLDDIYAQRPQPFESDRALACVVRQFALPKPLLLALLEGFAWDAEGRRYETLEDLEAYGARVAGSVGAMMAVIMGARDEQAVARACDLGVAMQLTNIARDVGEDARLGRIYLPQQWLREAGISPDVWLNQPVFDQRLAGVVARLLQAADVLYARAEHGIARLPRDCRPAILAARLVYAEIGRRLEELGLDSVNHRAVVPGRRKLVLLARASGAALLAPADSTLAAPALAATQFLVDASALPHGESQIRRSFADRMVWLAELYSRQADRDYRHNRHGLGEHSAGAH
jgi:phytoene synthase